MGLSQYLRYWLLLLILFSSFGCLNIKPKQINGISIEVSVKDHKLQQDSVKITLEQVDLTQYEVPGVQYPPFIAFRGYIIPKDKQNETHATFWGLVPYKGAGNYRVVLITEDGYSVKKGDSVSYYISLRGRDVRWSTSVISGVVVVE